MAYYATGTTPIASWIGQLGMRKVPESIRTVTAGRTRIIFVDVHDAGEPAPEEKWLRANTIAEKRPNRAAVTDFRPIDVAPTF